MCLCVFVDLCVVCAFLLFCFKMDGVFGLVWSGLGVFHLQPPPSHVEAGA